MVKTVGGAADEKGIDLLQVEYQQMVPLVLDVPARQSILDLHNVESALVASYARARRGPPPRPLPGRGGRACGAWSAGRSGTSTTWSWSASRSGRDWPRGPLRPGLPERPGAVGGPARGVRRHRGLRGHHGMGPQRRRRGLARARDLARGAWRGCPRPSSCSWARTRRRPCAPSPTAHRGDRHGGRRRARTWPGHGSSWRRCGPAEGHGSRSWRRSTSAGPWWPRRWAVRAWRTSWAEAWSWPTRHPHWPRRSRTCCSTRPRRGARAGRPRRGRGGPHLGRRAGAAARGGAPCDFLVLAGSPLGLARSRRRPLRPLGARRARSSWPRWSCSACWSSRPRSTPTRTASPAACSTPARARRSCGCPRSTSRSRWSPD